MIPDLETLKEQAPLTMEQFLQTEASKHTERNEFLAELTPEVITEKLKTKIEIIDALNIVEELRKQESLDEESKQNREIILNAAKLFYLENHVPTALRIYIDEEKKAKQLQELTETATFRQLTQKTKEDAKQEVRSEETKPKNLEPVLTLQEVERIKGSIEQKRIDVLQRITRAQEILNTSKLSKELTTAYQIVIAAAYEQALGTRLLNPDTIDKKEENQGTQPLEINIDLGKRKKQVEELTETDFFMDLQAKAKAMREKKS